MGSFVKELYQPYLIVPLKGLILHSPVDLDGRNPETDHQKHLHTRVLERIKRQIRPMSKDIESRFMAGTHRIYGLDGIKIWGDDEYRFYNDDPIGLQSLDFWYHMYDVKNKTFYMIVLCAYDLLSNRDENGNMSMDKNIEGMLDRANVKSSKIACLSNNDLFHRSIDFQKLPIPQIGEIIDMDDTQVKPNKNETLFRYSTTLPIKHDLLEYTTSYRKYNKCRTFGNSRWIYIGDYIEAHWMEYNLQTKEINLYKEVIDFNLKNNVIRLIGIPNQRITRKNYIRATNFISNVERCREHNIRVDDVIEYEQKLKRLTDEIRKANNPSVGITQKKF